MATNARVIDFVKQVVLAQTGSADTSTGSTQDQIIERKAKKLEEEKVYLMFLKDK